MLRNDTAAIFVVKGQGLIEVNTLLELLDIATESGYLFSRSQNIELKRFLLKFVFKNLWLTEGKLTYELNFPFELFEEKNVKRNNQNLLELVKPLEIKGLCEVFNQTAGNDNTNLLELQISDKKQRVRPKNLTRVLIGDANCAVSELKFSNKISTSKFGTLVIDIFIAA